MGVMLQAFFWDCPRVDNREFQWWEYVCQQVPSLAKVGFTSLWLPPVHKAANLSGPSMGYDPYDYYDLGEFDQKGTIPTWFGTKSQLLDLIQTAHHHGLRSQIQFRIERDQSAEEALVTGSMCGVRIIIPWIRGFASFEDQSLIQRNICLPRSFHERVR